MFVLRSTYDRMRAEAQALSALGVTLAECATKLTAERDAALAERDESYRRHAITEREACDRATEVGRLRAELEQLRAQGTPRLRGAGGRFVPVRETGQQEADRLLAADQQRRKRGECLHETTSRIDAREVREANLDRFARIEIRACMLPELDGHGNRRHGYRVWGYAA